MSRITLDLYNPQQARPLLTEAWEWVKAQTMAGNRVQLKAQTETRTIKQNKVMWSCLTDLSKQVEWLEGPHEAKHYDIDQLKAIKSKYAALTRQLKANQ